MAASAPAPHAWTLGTTVPTVVFLFIALFAPYWMGWNGYSTLLFTEKTYEQQYPAFQMIGETLRKKFETPSTFSCKGAVLPHPMEEVIERSLSETYLDSESLNLLFYGEAMLGKVGASV